MNSTNSTSAPTQSGHQISNTGMIISFSVLGFLILDIVIISLWACRRFGSPDRRARQRLKFKTSSKESRLQKLQKVAPKESFETWWKGLKSDLHLSNEVDSTFVCAICLDSVTKNQTIHELKCHHVFHDVCLERWFLECHFTCPMCHDVFYKELGGGDVSEEETSSSDMV